MFTVKQITASGIEYLWEAVNVAYQPAIAGAPADAVPERVNINVAGGNNIDITGGTVFVMNDKGKTVSRYDLGPSMVPLMSGPVRADGVDPHLTAHLARAEEIDILAKARADLRS